jgi:hypothetical protein
MCDFSFMAAKGFVCEILLHVTHKKKKEILSQMKFIKREEGIGRYETTKRS